MNTFQLEEVRQSEDSHRIDLSIRLGDEQHQLFFSSKDASLKFDLDALLTFTLPVCMVEQADWTPEGPINQVIWHNLPQIMDFFQAWKPHLYRPKLPNITPVVRPVNTQTGSGLFFTGGVDSFFTLYKHLDQITHLVYIHGLEMSLDNLPLRNQISQMLRKVGTELGKNVIEIETNIRKFSSNFAGRRITHGFELVGFAFLLQNFFNRVWISDGVTYDQIIPQSLHPEVTSLLESQVMGISFVGNDLTRLEKTAILSRQTDFLSEKPKEFFQVTPEQSKLMMQTLRICNENRGGAYNCGKCEKCLRTMIDLRLVNALDQCTTIKTPLDLNRIARLDIPKESHKIFLQNSLQELIRTDRDPELQLALKKALGHDHLVKKVKRWTSRRLRRLFKRKSWY